MLDIGHFLDVSRDSITVIDTVEKLLVDSKSKPYSPLRGKHLQLVAPSPKKQDDNFTGLFHLLSKGQHLLQFPIPPPTIPLAPRFPASRSDDMRMEPPFPLQVPVYLPRISAIMPFKSIPLAMACPCPRWLEVIKVIVV